MRSATTEPDQGGPQHPNRPRIHQYSTYLFGAVEPAGGWPRFLAQVRLFFLQPIINKLRPPGSRKPQDPGHPTLRAVIPTEGFSPSGGTRFPICHPERRFGRGSGRTGVEGPLYRLVTLTCDRRTFRSCRVWVKLPTYSAPHRRNRAFHWPADMCSATLRTPHADVAFTNSTNPSSTTRGTLHLQQIRPR